MRRTVILAAAMLIATSLAFSGERRPPRPENTNTGRVVSADGANKTLESWLKITAFDINRDDETVTSIVVEGTAGKLPDRAIVKIVLCFEGKSFYSHKTMVVSGKFKCAYRPGNKKYFFGKYQLTVTFNPRRGQDPDVVKYIEREFGPERVKLKQNAEKEEMLGTDQSRLAEIETLKDDYRTYLKTLFKYYRELPEKGDEFKPKPGAELQEADYKTRERKWLKFKRKLESDVRRIKYEFTDEDGKYANYIYMRFPECAEKIVKICDAIIKLAAQKTVNACAAWGKKPPKADDAASRATVRTSKVYLERYLFTPILIELGIKKTQIGWKPEEENEKKSLK